MQHPTRQPTTDGFCLDVALAILLARSPLRHYAHGVAWRPPEQPGTVRYATNEQILELGRRATANPDARSNYTDWLSDEDPISVTATWVLSHYGIEACADLETLRLCALWDQQAEVVAAVDLLAPEIAELVKDAAS